KILLTKNRGEKNPRNPFAASGLNKTAAQSSVKRFSVGNCISFFMLNIDDSHFGATLERVLVAARFASGRRLGLARIIAAGAASTSGGPRRCEQASGGFLHPDLSLGGAQPIRDL